MPVWVFQLIVPVVKSGPTTEVVEFFNPSVFNQKSVAYIDVLPASFVNNQISAAARNVNNLLISYRYIPCINAVDHKAPALFEIDAVKN